MESSPSGLEIEAHSFEAVFSGMCLEGGLVAINFEYFDLPVAAVCVEGGEYVRIANELMNSTFLGIGYVSLIVIDGNLKRSGGCSRSLEKILWGKSGTACADGRGVVDGTTFIFCQRS